MQLDLVLLLPLPLALELPSPLLVSSATNVATESIAASLSTLYAFAPATGENETVTWPTQSTGAGTAYFRSVASGGG